MKSKTNRCNSCHAPNNTGTSRIKHGNCYSCRKKVHQPIIPNEVPRWRLILILSTAALTFIAISARSIYYQHIAFPYLRNRSRVVWYEFTGMEVAVPILVLALLSAGLLAISIAHYDKRLNSKAYKKTIIYSLCTGWFLYLISIFSGIGLHKY